MPGDHWLLGKKKAGRQSKDRGTRFAGQRQGRFRAVGGHIGSQAHKIAFGMGDKGYGIGG